MNRIVCIGNELSGDDGIGIRIGRVLAELPLPPEIDLCVVPELGFGCLELFCHVEHLVLVDAMTTGQPRGSCQVVQEAQLATLAGSSGSSHGLGAGHLIEVARRLRAGGPVRVTCVGVEVESCECFTVALTAAVQAALPAAVDSVLRALGATPELLELGRRRATEWSRRELAIQDLLLPPCPPKGSSSGDPGHSLLRR
jgi:hydrogenase maturation protease